MMAGKFPLRRSGQFRRIIGCLVAIATVAYATAGVVADAPSPNRVAAFTPASIEEAEATQPNAEETASASAERSVAPMTRRQSDSASDEAPAATGLALNSVEMWWPLAAVLGVIVLGAVFMRRWMPKSAGLSGADVIHVLGRRTLSGKHSLCLVRVGKRVVLVGMTPERMTALTELDNAAEVSELIAGAERSRPGSFTSMFTTASSEELPAEEESNAVPRIEDDPMVSSQQLEETGRDVHALIDRVRALSAGFQSSSETADQASLETRA